MARVTGKIKEYFFDIDFRTRELWGNCGVLHVADVQVIVSKKDATGMYYCKPRDAVPNYVRKYMARRFNNYLSRRRLKLVVMSDAFDPDAEGYTKYKRTGVNGLHMLAKYGGWTKTESVINPNTLHHVAVSTKAFGEVTTKHGEFNEF